MIAMLVVLWPGTFGLRGNATPKIYQTQVGGLKDVRLPDGSRVILGGRTELSIGFSTQRRTVSVIEGQAWFKVAHDAKRPFIVTAGNGMITDLGTAFLVTRDSDRVVVTVTEGSVEVSARQPMRLPLTLGHGVVLKSALTPIRVSYGEQLAFSDAGILDPLKEADAHAALAWTHGRLTFDDQPLRYVIEAVNRYSSRRISVSPAAGALRFSGIVFDDQIEDWLQSLEVIFPVLVDDQGSNVRVQMRTIPASDKSPSKKRD